MLKRFFTNIALIIVPIAVLMFLVNIKVDSGFIASDQTDKIANILASGKNAAIISVPSHWGRLQKAIVEEKRKPFSKNATNVIVFGTSRSAEINSKMFPQNGFHNCAIPGGTILDYVALYGLYKKSNLLPTYLILSIDPWSFHSRKEVTINKEVQYVADSTIPLDVTAELKDDLNNGLTYLGVNVQKHPSVPKSEANFKALIELLSPKYFQLNIPYLFRKSVVETNEDVLDSYFIIRSDGGYSISSQVDSILVEEKSNRFVAIHKNNFFISSDTISTYWAYFEKLLVALKKDGVIPVIYISPVNPIVYDNLASKGETGLEKGVRDICKKNSIFCIGSFNPHIYGYHSSGNSFRDAYHPVKSVIERIFCFHNNDLNNIGLRIKPVSCK